jgi:hypothetical protein
MRFVVWEEGGEEGTKQGRRGGGGEEGRRGGGREEGRRSGGE